MRQSCLRTAVTSFPAIPLHEKHQFVFSTLIITDIQYGVICITLIVSYRRSFDHVNPFRCRGAWKASRCLGGQRPGCRSQCLFANRLPLCSYADPLCGSVRGRWIVPWACGLRSESKDLETRAVTRARGN